MEICGRPISRGWQLVSVILPLMHICLCIGNAPSDTKVGYLLPLIYVDFPLSIVLLGLAWNSHYLFVWFGVLGTLWWYLLVRFAEILSRMFLSLKLLQDRRRQFIWLSLCAIWILIWILALVPVFLCRGGSHLAFTGAELTEKLFVLTLSFPSGMLVYWIHTFDYFVITGNPETDLMPIVSSWILSFTIGTLQWFVLVPSFTRWALRKSGDKDAGKTP